MNWMKTLATLFLIIAVTTTANAQEAVLSSGGDLSFASGSLSYSIGQVNYTFSEDGNFSISEGVQQAFDVQMLNLEEEPYGVIMNITTFPNPFNEVLTLIIESEWYEGLTYSIYSLDGKLVAQEALLASRTDIRTADLAPATYFLHVSNDEGPVQTFKIQKH